MVAIVNSGRERRSDDCAALRCEKSQIAASGVRVAPLLPPFPTLLSPDLDRLLGRAIAGRLFLLRHHLDAPISAFTRMLEGRRCGKVGRKGRPLEAERTNSPS